ncbi:MAG TPA: BamA/TamA family outer membrane protein [Planctomycetota bacterium]|nr:BamA/TamA family outer membrane protein [Planctomycetota bacterium]
MPLAALVLTLMATLAATPFQAPPQSQEPAPPPKEPKQSIPPKLGDDEPGTSFFPMPSIASDKDSGMTYGFLAALMFTNDQGIQDGLLSATVTYNRLVKVGGEVEFRYYPTLTGVVDLDAYIAQRVESSLHLFYEETRLADLWHGRFEYFDQRSSTDRFFGRGDGNPVSQESVRTSDEYRAEARFGPRLNNRWDVEGTLRWRHYRVGDSLITDHPQMTTLYPNEPGIEGGDVVAGGVRIVGESRDSVTTPTSGTYVTAYFESAEDYAPGKSHPYWNCGASQTTLWPMDKEKRFVTVLNTATQLAIGHYIPFWELPAIGGSTTLRSFNGGRFTNKDMILMNVEERIRIHEASLWGVSGEVQVAPFFDLGKVFDSSGDLVGRGSLQYFHYSYGFGLRGVVNPSFVGRLDVGFGGREGVGVTIGLDYPF